MAGLSSRFLVRDVPVESVRCWEGNPRWISEARLEELKRGLAADPQMLYARPLLALPDGRVFAGNQRLRAVQELGWATVPVLTVELDARRAQVWALRDNNEYGEWDEAALTALLGELAEGGVELSLTGFSSADLDRYLAGIVAPVDPDDVPDLADETLESKPGEVYRLGDHLLLCGDATDASELRRVVGDARPEVLWTDPPYGVDYVGKTTRQLRIQHDDNAGLPTLLRDAFAAADSVLAPGSRFYIAAPAGPQGTAFRGALVEVGWHLHQVLVWVKNTPVLGHSDHHFAHEDVLYGWRPGPGRPGRGRHKGSRWYGGNDKTSVFFVDRPQRSSEHPTMKPVELIAQQLQNSSCRGDVILDPFAGSGSTLIACEQLGRRCIAVEIDPRYCDVIRRRFEAFVHGR